MTLTAPESATDALVRGLRLCVHLAFGGLLGFGMVTLILRGDLAILGGWGPMALAAVLAAVYVAGTAVERTRAMRAGYGQRPDIPASWWVSWLVAVLLIWGLLVLREPAFAYCAFPLFFVILHLVRPLWAGLLAVLGLLLWLIYAFWRMGQFGAGAVVGPTVGAGFSVVVFIIYEALVRDSLQQRRALAELAATRDELAVAQHAAGVTAERERFSAEIHDTLAQGLNAIVLTARAGLAARPGGSARPQDEDPAGAPRAALEQILGLASANLAEARDMVRGSRDSHAGPQTNQLAQEIHAAVERVGVEDLDVTIRDERLQSALSAPLPPAVHRLMVLAASSLTANVVRHAKARRAVLTVDLLPVEDGPGTLSLDVVDDGQGFSPTSTPPGFGLSSLQERAERLGGTLVIESAPGEGTAVNLTVPLKEKP
jgi:signal transduction histidine kinase